MLRATLQPICPACRISGDFPRRMLQGQQSPLSIVPQRLFGTKTRTDSSKRRSNRPSRMVLSDRVARPASARGDSSSGRAPAQRRVDGPFAGMNRTVANIDPRDPRLRRTTTNNSSKGRRDGSSDERDDRGVRRDGRDFKALKMQRALASISYGQRTAIKTRMQEVDSFDQFSLLPVVKEAVLSSALKGMVDIKPTPIQRLAIPELLGQGRAGRSSRSKPEAAGDGGRQEFLLAAETGSGKTLAYLVPAINAVKKAETDDPEIVAYNQRRAEEAEKQRLDSRLKPVPEPHPTMARPKVVVLVPTAELVDQVGAVVKSLGHVAKVKTRLVSANFSPTVIDSRIFSPSGLDVLVTTPHLLASIADSHPNVVSRVSHLIIDEADSLFDRSFTPVTTAVIDRALPSVRQLVLCSATIPRRLDNYLAARFPAMRRVTTPNLHAIPRRVQLGVIDVSRDPYRNNKDLACADAIWSIGKEAARHEGAVKGEVDVRRIMVFVNEREKTQEVADYLVARGIDAVALHRDTAEQRQSEMLASFTTKDPLTVPAVPAAAPPDVSAGGASPSSLPYPASSLAPSPHPFRATGGALAGAGAGAGGGAGRGGGRALPNTKVIVATDLASRGIDTLAVRHVVLYDVPHTTIDFIHRLGRAGRMGRRGRGIVLVGKDDRRDVVAEVKESMFMGKALV